MKKLLKFLALGLVTIIVTGGIFIFDRYQKNPEQVTPFPYTFEQKAPAIKLDAPILIIGDMMGDYMAKFKTELAATISVNLSAPIKIQSLAREGNALHRNLHELKSLTQWPQILIYQGGSEELKENTFALTEISKIHTNFQRFKDDRIATLLMLHPWLSRLIYEPLERVKLPEAVQLSTLSEDEYLKRLETELMLYREELIELIDQSRNRSTLLILTTTPLNLDVPPKKVCDFTTTPELSAQLKRLSDLMEQDPKTAYQDSNDLLKQHSSNALLHFIHGQSAKRLGKPEEAKRALLEASAFDCEPWRATAIQNSIIRKVAKEQQVVLFDFAQMVENDWSSGTTFFDEIHPQNLYYEKGMQQLGLVIKEILKL